MIDKLLRSKEMDRVLAKNPKLKNPMAIVKFVNKMKRVDRSMKQIGRLQKMVGMKPSYKGSRNSGIWKKIGQGQKRFFGAKKRFDKAINTYQRAMGSGSKLVRKRVRRRVRKCSHGRCHYKWVTSFKLVSVRTKLKTQSLSSITHSSGTSNMISNLRSRTRTKMNTIKKSVQIAK
jgi:hypothetical protein